MRLIAWRMMRGIALWLFSVMYAKEIRELSYISIDLSMDREKGVAIAVSIAYRRFLEHLGLRRYPEDEL